MARFTVTGTIEVDIIATVEAEDFDDAAYVMAGKDFDDIPQEWQGYFE